MIDPIRAQLVKDTLWRLDRPTDLTTRQRLERLARLVSELRRGRTSIRTLLMEIACEALCWVESMDRAELHRVDLGDELEAA